MFGLGLGITLGLVVSCAGKDRVQDIYSPGAAPTGASAEESAPMEDLADAYGADESPVAESDAPRGRNADEALDLAAYERLLEQQELRLRSAGVAMRGEAMYAEDGSQGSTVDSSAGLVGAGSAPPSVGDSGPTPSTKSTTKKKNKKKKNKKKTSSSASRRDVPESSPSRAEAEEEKENRCSTICDLAASTCDLERQICDLASRHPDEERYAQVCARAADDCLLARNACQACPV